MQILPFLEYQPLYDAFDFKKENIESTTFSESNELVSSTLIPEILCPSDDRETHYDGRATLNYAASRGPTEVWWNSACFCDYEWASLAQAPIDDKKNFAGPFTRVGTPVALREITDGLSHTIFFGEVRPLCSEHARNGWLASNNGNGYATTLIPINYDTCNDSAPNPCRRSCTWNTEVGFKSTHPGGAHFLFGDGSTRLVHETVEHNAYQNMGAKSDGQVISQ